jgi:hypothetical protein
MKRAGIAGVIASMAVLAGSVLPAQAATTPGWRQIESQHYGPAVNGSSYTTVLATGSKNAWAFGGTDLSGGDGTTQAPVAAHWNGRTWGNSKLPSAAKGYIEAASAPAANDIWAVTFNGGYVLHYNGSAWTVAKTLPAKRSDGFPLDTTGVVAFSAKNVWVFGGSGFGPGEGTWHYNGSTWTNVTSAGDEGDLSEASATSASSIWALGGSGVPAADSLVHYNGRAWTSAYSSALNGYALESLTALPGKTTDLWLGASSQSNAYQSYLLHYGDHWSKVLVPWGLAIRSNVASDGHGGLWFTAGAKTGSEWLVHWLPGNKWQREEINARLGTPTLVPGTSALLDSGLILGKTHGANAVVWAYGTI